MKRSINISRFPIILVLGFSFCFYSCEENSSYVETRENQYERVLSELHKRGQFNGNALIVENGEVVYQGAFGIKSINPIDSLDINTVFRLGSISKTFTAMAIMILKEEGKLDYDQDIRDFIPKLPYSNITIRHLLNHTSGLPDFSNMMDVNWKPDLDFDDPAKAVSGNDDVINMLIEKHPPAHFQPMEKWEYSNTGYLLLATIASKVSQMPFERFLNEKIFKPVGMNSTTVYKYVDGEDKDMPNRAYGFLEGLRGKFTSTDYHYLNNTKGEGGIYSTIGDLSKWDKVLYTTKLISEETKKEAFSSPTLKDGSTIPYGFGWFVEKSLNGKNVVQHSGGWAGFITYLYREVEEGNCIILLTNNSTAYYSILDLLTKIMHKQPYKLPRMQFFNKVGEMAMEKGANSAIELYKKLKVDSLDHYAFDERQINVIGYELMSEGKIDDAVKFFQLNTEEYPQSANAFDSYGDGLLEQGDTSNALKSFKKTIELDSTFWITKEKIKKLQ